MRNSFNRSTASSRLIWIGSWRVGVTVAGLIKCGRSGTDVGSVGVGSLFNSGGLAGLGSALELL